MSRIPNTFVTLQKKTKISYMIRLNSLAIAGVAQPHHPYEVDSFMGIHLHHPYLSDNRLSSLSYLRTFPLCRWRYFHRSQHSLGHFLSHLRNKMEETTDQAVLFSCSKERLLSQEEGSFRKSSRISAVGICLVLYSLGTELLAAEYLLQNGHEACGSI